MLSNYCPSHSSCRLPFQLLLEMFINCDLKFILFISRQIYYVYIPANLLCLYPGKLIMFISRQIYYVYIPANLLCLYPGKFIMFISRQVYYVYIPASLLCLYPGQFLIFDFLDFSHILTRVYS